MSRKNRILVWILFVCLFLTYFFVEKQVRYVAYYKPKVEKEHILPDKKVAPLLAMGFRNVMADLYTLKAQIHNHETAKKGLLKDGKVLFDMMELVMALDPHYKDAFLFGSVALSEFWGNMGVADSNTLLRKAWFHNQDEHRFPMYMGYNYYSNGENKNQAIKWFRAALLDPDAPKRLVWVVDALLSDEDLNSQIQRDSVCEICEEAEEEFQKKQYCARCEFYIRLIELNEGAKIFKQREGKPMQHISDLVTYGYLDELPREPLGGRWYLNDKGVIVSTVTNRQSIIVEQEEK